MGVAPRGVARRLWRRPPEGRPPTRKTRPRAAAAAAASRACSFARTRPAVPAGSASARRPPALPAGAGRSRRRIAGWLHQSPRAWAAAHVSRRHVRARPRGLRQLPLQKLACRGSAHPIGFGARDAAGRRGLGARRGVRIARGHGDPRCAALPLPRVRRFRRLVRGWARWLCPRARRPRGAHRLDPGGPAAGRRPQFHGWFGAR